MLRENDIVLFNLHRRYLGRKPTFGGFLGIYLLAAFLGESGWRAQAFSGSLREGRELVDELAAAKKIRAVGLYADYANVTENEKIARYVAEHYRLPVFVGGPQAAFLPRAFYENSRCAAVVRGEGELTLLELLDFFLDGTGELSEILGISYLAGGEVQQTPPRPAIRNLDVLPFVTDDCYLLPRPRPYELSIMTGRGCPFSCAFCHEGAHTRGVRRRSAGNVLAEIDAHFAAHPLEDSFHLLFVDDTLTLDVRRLASLCAGLAARREKTPFVWFAEGHVHTIARHPEMLRMMARAGCQRLQLGIEAGTEAALTAYGKHTTPEEIKEVVRLARDAGIVQIFGNIIVGGAQFSRERLAADRAFAEELLEIGAGTLELGVVYFWPLAGTAMTSEPEKFGIETHDLDFMTCAEDFPQSSTRELSRLDVLRLGQELTKALREKMRQMLLARQIPRERILGFFLPGERHKYFGTWRHVLRELPQCESYYSLLAAGEAVELSDAAGEAADFVPLRTVPLAEFLKTRADGTAEIFGLRLAPLERDLLICAAGRFPLQRIAARLAPRYGTLTAEQLLPPLRRLAEAFLVVIAEE